MRRLVVNRKGQSTLCSMVLTVALPVLPLSPDSPRRRSSLAARRNFVLQPKYLHPPASGAADDAVRGDRIGSSGWRLAAWHGSKAKVATDQEAVASQTKRSSTASAAAAASSAAAVHRPSESLSDKRQRTTTTAATPGSNHSSWLVVRTVWKWRRRREETRWCAKAASATWFDIARAATCKENHVRKRSGGSKRTEEWGRIHGTLDLCLHSASLLFAPLSLRPSKHKVAETT